jgi:hypothetical protein
VPPSPPLDELPPDEPPAPPAAVKVDERLMAVELVAVRLIVPPFPPLPQLVVLLLFPTPPVAVRLLEVFTVTIEPDNVIEPALPPAAPTPLLGLAPAPPVVVIAFAIVIVPGVFIDMEPPRQPIATAGVDAPVPALPVKLITAVFVIVLLAVNVKMYEVDVEGFCAVSVLETVIVPALDADALAVTIVTLPTVNPVPVSLLVISATCTLTVVEPDAVGVNV